MSSGKNSLSTLLLQIIRRDNNILNVLSSLQKLTITDDQEVTLEWEDTGGVVSKFKLPSIGYIMTEINKLNNNVSTLSGLNLKKAKIILKDGTQRTIVSSTLPIEPSPISNLEVPLYFSTRSNKIHHRLIDPLLYLKIKVPNTEIESSFVSVKRVILDLDNDDKKSYFNTNLLKQNLDYDALINTLVEQDISYEEYDSEEKLKNKKQKYVGDFSVLSIGKKLINGVNKTIINLDLTSYKNRENGSDVILKVGDTLVLNKSPKSTIFKVNYIDLSKRDVELIKVEGYQYPQVGSKMFSIYSTEFIGQELEVPIAPDQYVFVFYKNVNANLNIESATWGVGVGLNTNTLISDEDLQTDLASYAESSINNYSKALEHIAAEKIIPLSDLVKPNVPVLNPDFFKVVLANDHKQEKEESDKIKAIYADKLKLDGSVSLVNKDIDSAKLKLATQDYKTVQEKNLIESDLSKSIEQKAKLLKEIETKINELNVKISNTKPFEPYYQIIGTIDIPQPQYKDKIAKSGKQEVIGFDIEYRYISKSKSVKPGTELSLITTEDGTKQKPILSKWNKVPQVVKLKEKDGSWKKEDYKNPDEININQIAITITKGENVEIRVRSLSEVGFPYSKNYSDWSTPIVVEFPESLIENNALLFENIFNAKVISDFRNVLVDEGIVGHPSDAIKVGDKDFKHSAANIFSTFYDANNKPLSEAEKISLMDSNLKNLIATLNNEKPKINVIITDELGNKVTSVSQNGTAKIFAGYYKDIVSGLSVPKGEVVTKLYYVEVSNLSDADMELLSYVPGNFYDRIPNTGTTSPDNTYFGNDPNFDGYIHNKIEYNLYRKYWNVPVSLRGIVYNSDLFSHYTNNLLPFMQLPIFMSHQTKGQFVYARSRDITLNTNLYGIGGALHNDDFLMPVFGGVNPAQSFIWNGAQTPLLGSPIGGGKETDFCVHTSHPDLLHTGDPDEYMTDWLSYYTTSDPYPTLPKLTTDSLTAPTKILSPKFSHSKFFNLESTNPSGLIQLANRPFGNTNGSADFQHFPRRIGFSNNDKYLIGKNTCGAYLFLAPSLQKSFYSGETIYNKGLIIKKGENKVKIPVIFQARMTDYYGSGSTGIGRIGGYVSGKNNLSYQKKIGLDLLIKNQDIFSFDIQIEMQYAPLSASFINQSTVNS